MSVEFVDTNVLVYAHDGSAGAKHVQSTELLRRLTEDRSGALSIQVLGEFYVTATKKLRMIIRRPAHADLLRAASLHRRYGVSWWDACILNSAAELGCRLLWTEDLSDGRRYGPVTVRNPFRA